MQKTKRNKMLEANIHKNDFESHEQDSRCKYSSCD
jgi:hypothetical protein